MEIRHDFTAGIVAMEPISLDLTNIDAETALAAIERARDDAWSVCHDFIGALQSAEAFIINTGSVHGNARPVQIDASGCDSLCRRCMGAGEVLMIGTPSYGYNADVSGGYRPCADCGGTGLSSPVIG